MKLKYESEIFLIFKSIIVFSITVDRVERLPDFHWRDLTAENQAKNSIYVLNMSLFRICFFKTN